MPLINDLSRHSRALRDEIIDALTAVVDGGSFILGSEVREFESEFAAYCGQKHCVSVANGTDALELGLRALQVGPGQIVATPANCGFYATCAIRLVGATPAYVDVDPSSGLLCMDAFERACHEYRPSATIATHLYGRMVDMRSLVPIAREHGLRIIEDCAQCHGARLEGRSAGSWGDLGCFSFYPTKNLGGIGDSGAIVMSDDGLANSVRRLRQYGWATKYRAEMSQGRNSRMDELQAAVLRRFLPHLDGWNERRRQIAAQYCSLIQNPHVRPLAGSGSAYVAHLFVVSCEGRDSLREHLTHQGIASDVHYPVPDHLQVGNRRDWLSRGLLVTEKMASDVLTLPCFPEMAEDEIRVVARGVNGWIA